MQTPITITHDCTPNGLFGRHVTEIICPTAKAGVTIESIAKEKENNGQGRESPSRALDRCSTLPAEILYAPSDPGRALGLLWGRRAA